MSNLATLKPFQPGPDPRRNTKGRPKGSSNLKKLLLKELKKDVEFEGGKMKLEDVLVRKLVNMALTDKNTNRKLEAIKYIINVIDGKPKATADLPAHEDWHITPERRAEVLKMIGIQQDDSNK